MKKTPRKKRFTGKKKINARKIVYDGIQFQSLLERDFYKKIKLFNLPLLYEPKTYEVLPAMKAPETFRNFKTWGTKFLERSSNTQNMKYTPDFVYEGDKHYIYVENKGRPNESYPLRKKLFFVYLSKIKNREVWFFEPKNQVQNSIVIEKIKEILT
jgi:hypothetical protein